MSRKYVFFFWIFDFLAKWKKTGGRYNSVIRPLPLVNLHASHIEPQNAFAVAILLFVGLSVVSMAAAHPSVNGGGGVPKPGAFITPQVWCLEN